MPVPSFDYQTDRVRVIASIQGHIDHLANLEPEWIAATALVYEATREWFDSKGGGTWPKLAVQTKINKAAMGYADPARPLYAEGNLYHSVTSRSGPYSRVTPMGRHGVLIQADWEKGGHQIPEVLGKGTRDSGYGHSTIIPSRPIWPAPLHPIGMWLRQKIGKLLLGRGGGDMIFAPAFPGAHVGRGTGGRFVSLKTGHSV